MSPEMLTALAAVLGTIGGFALNLIFTLLKRPQEQQQNNANIAQTVRVIYDEMIDDIKARYDERIEDLVAKITEQNARLDRQRQEISCLHEGQRERDQMIANLEERDTRQAWQIEQLETALNQTRRELDAAKAQIRHLEEEREQLKTELDAYRTGRRRKAAGNDAA